MRLPERLKTLVEADEQAQLVVQINALAYQINQASIANVEIVQKPSSINVIVRRHFQEVPQIAAIFGLTEAEVKHQPTQNLSSALQIMRLRGIVHDLQAILNEGLPPTGEAA